MSVAVIFPGQGSQEFNMGRSVAESSKDFMSLWEKAETTSGLPLREVYWESDDAELMANTRYLQPALTVVNITTWAFFSQKLDPRCFAGHSLGEFSAFVAAKVLSPGDAIELTCVRGALMEEADEQGGMAAVLRLSQEEVASIVKEVESASGELIVIANYNTPSQFVISGKKSAISAASSIVKEKKGRLVPLSVSGAFHSPLMEKVAEKFATYLEKKSWLTPTVPVYSNTNGSACSTKEQVYSCILRQMTSPVYWIDTVVRQWEEGTRSWVEVGSKGILSRMIAPILESVSVCQGFSTTSLNNMEKVDASD